ncbi:signal peptidase I [Candidatus Liberibacter sp.]|uniref:signal peptidase I n=1 Tax=Candidatus Liberibacter sp. TaxID=34022 RepID=UPI0015F6AD8C|nr:signal peptidase I [Candidatus Liberibacter sp.]MBA5723995.1 signal peptidase I [Candidatus Liberibacter sp.]
MWIHKKHRLFLWENAKEILSYWPYLLLFVFIRAFLFQPSSIPSGSMIPTLLVGDHLIVNKFSYGYSKYSLPFSYNLFNGRFFNQKPERGDIVVFRLPRDPTIDYVKRLIGLPGDRVSLKKGVVYINDVAVSRHPDGTFPYQYKAVWSENIPAFREALSNGVSYKVLSWPFSPNNNTSEFLVPEGHYFMMGDNRDNSIDSRFVDVGFVPEENLIGRASIVLFSIANNTPFYKIWLSIPNIRWDRFFKVL